MEVGLLAVEDVRAVEVGLERVVLFLHGVRELTMTELLQALLVEAVVDLGVGVGGLAGLEGAVFLELLLFSL